MNRVGDIGIQNISTRYQAQTNQQAPDEAALGTIMSRLAKVEHTANVIQSKMVMLDKKLSHVLTTVPANGDQCEARAKGGLPPLAERLDALYDKLSDVNGHVDQLIDRVDI